MTIQVKGYLTLQKLVGKRSIEVAEGETLRALLETLAREIGATFAGQVLAAEGGPQEHIAVLVNGRSHRNLLHVLDTRLHDGDEVAMFPPVMGG